MRDRDPFHDSRRPGHPVLAPPRCPTCDIEYEGTFDLWEVQAARRLCSSMTGPHADTTEER